MSEKEEIWEFGRHGGQCICLEEFKRKCYNCQVPMCVCRYGPRKKAYGAKIRTKEGSVQLCIRCTCLKFPEDVRLYDPPANWNSTS